MLRRDGPSSYWAGWEHERSGRWELAANPYPAGTAEAAKWAEGFQDRREVCRILEGTGLAVDEGEERGPWTD